MQIRLSLVLLILLFCGKISAQKKYVVLLKDKNGNGFSIAKPSEFLSQKSITRRANQGISVNMRDLPVTPSYLAEIRKTGASVIYPSKWMNGALVLATDDQVSAIKKLSFVNSILDNSDISGARLSNQTKKTKFNETTSPQIDFDYGASLTQAHQLGADSLHKNGYTGKGVWIALLDAGFLKANNLSVFNDLFTQNRIVTTYDFVDNETDVYDDDSHGTSVLSCIVGNTPGQLIGTAPDATMILFRTEDASTESKIEEVYWTIAAEKADSLGVDIISTSLGYTEFDNPAQNYTYADMNGHKTISAKAANAAASVGIIVLASAGNSGGDSWNYIGTPADADSVIAVGAVNSFEKVASFSSFGPNANKQIKPELAAMGQGTVLANTINTISKGNGTSFSAPVLAGFVAALKQQYPTLSAWKMREMLIKSGSQYTAPDNRLGYGIPRYASVNALIKQYVSPILATEIDSEEISVFPNPANNIENVQVLLNNAPLRNSDSIEIFDVKGSKLGQLETDKKNNFPKLTSGNYFLKINAGNKIYRKKLIIN